MTEIDPAAENDGPTLLWYYAHMALGVSDHPDLRSAVGTGYWMDDMGTAAPHGIQHAGRYLPWSDPEVQALVDEYEAKVEADRVLDALRGGGAHIAESEPGWLVEVRCPDSDIGQRWKATSRWDTKGAAEDHATWLARATGAEGVRVTPERRTS